MGSFSSKIGVLLAAAGSAVGLGSIWKFPYVVGENGGGAFIILYVVCSLIFGLPLVINEFMIGKLSGKSAYGAYRTLSGNSHWQWLSWVTFVTVTLLTSFYFVVTGWCFYYMVEAAMNTFAGMNAEGLTDFFEAFEHNSPTMIGYAIVAIVLTAAVLWFEVNKGIERLSKILMPLLFIMLIVMAIHMVFLDGGTTGLRFLFEPDFSKLTPKVILGAVGLSFFTLSIGLGILITYGGYMPKEQGETMDYKEEEVVTTSIQMIALVILVSLLAGMIVFPAVFAYGFSPAEGPQLTFVTLPAVFHNMFCPTLTSVSFFALMCVA
ncbi:MAG: sodium-dependent transporter, partial [Prevotella sp.]|nr:sodium-dependent transporter [Prevotella sp.]